VGEAPGVPCHEHMAPAQCSQTCCTGARHGQMVPLCNHMETLHGIWVAFSPGHGEVVAWIPQVFGIGTSHASQGGLQGVQARCSLGRGPTRRLCGGSRRHQLPFNPRHSCSLGREEQLGSWMASFGHWMGLGAPHNLLGPSPGSTLHPASGITLQPGRVLGQTHICTCSSGCVPLTQSKVGRVGPSLGPLPLTSLGLWGPLAPVGVFSKCSPLCSPCGAVKPRWLAG